MSRLRSMCKWSVVAVAAGLTLASGPVPAGQGQDRDKQAPDQAWAPPPDRTATWHAPTYYDTPEDRLMRVLTDDGSHDRSDMQR